MFYLRFGAPFKDDVLSLYLVLDVRVVEYGRKSVFQRFIIDIDGDTHIGKQIGRIHEILPRLLDNAAEHFGSRLVYSPDCNVLCGTNCTDTQQYE